MSSGHKYENITASGSARQQVGDSHYTTNNYYPLRQRRSDETIRYDKRGDRLLEAAKEGQLLRLQYLIKELGVSVDHEDDYGLTALHCAAWSGYLDCVEFLIKRGAYVNAQSRRYGTPLCLAIIRGHLDITRYLLREHRANVNGHGGKMGSALHAACYVNHQHGPKDRIRSEFLRILISSGAEVSSGRWISQKFMSDLQDILRPGPTDKAYDDKLFCVPIHLAIFRCSSDTLHLLLENGADVNIVSETLPFYPHRTQSPPLLDCPDESYTAFAHAVLREFAPGELTKVACAVFAVALFSPEKLQILLETGYSTEVSDDTGETPLMKSAFSQQIESLKLLLGYGANVLRRSNKGDTALDLAKRSLSIIELGEKWQCISVIEAAERQARIIESMGIAAPNLMPEFSKSEQRQRRNDKPKTMTLERLADTERPTVLMRASYNTISNASSGQALDDDLPIAHIRPPLPAPTPSPTESEQAFWLEDKAQVDKFTYIIPNDGRPLTFPTWKIREILGLKPDEEMPDLPVSLEYFEGSKNGSDIEKRQHVRIRFDRRKIKNASEETGVVQISTPHSNRKSSDARKASTTRQMTLAGDLLNNKNITPIQTSFVDRNDKKIPSDSRAASPTPSNVSSMPPDSMMDEDSPRIDLSEDDAHPT